MKMQYFMINLLNYKHEYNLIQTLFLHDASSAALLKNVQHGGFSEHTWK